MPDCEYISREIAIDAICQCGVDCGDAVSAVEEIPAADVKTVIHSGWELIKIGDGIFDYYFRCKHCHKNTPDRSFIIAPDFCPHCGASMDDEA